MKKRPTGFEGAGQQQMEAWRRAVAGELVEDDPSFQSAREIAEHIGVTEVTVRRWIRMHPQLVDSKTVRRPGIKNWVKVFRLKESP